MLGIEITKPALYHYYDVYGIGFQPGSLIVTTENLAKKHEWTSIRHKKQIRVSAHDAIETTGVDTRTLTGPNEDILSMAIKASKQALGIEGTTDEEAKKVLDQVRILMFNTSSEMRKLPGLAPELAMTLGLRKDVLVLEYRQACAAAPYLIDQALVNLDNPKYTEGDIALVVSSDDLPGQTNFDDYNTGSLFAAAAGSMALVKSKNRRLAFMHAEHHGDLADAIQIPSEQHDMVMDGILVFKEMSQRVPAAARSFFEETGLKVDDFDFAAFHQASFKMVNAIREKIKIPKEQTLLILDRYGNASAASTFGVLKEAYEQKKLGRTLMACFGAGVLIGVSCIEFDKQANAYHPHSLLERILKPFKRLLPFGHLSPFRRLPGIRLSKKELNQAA